MSNYLDFNDADKQQAFDCIPANTVVALSMQIKPGGLGEGGWLTPSKSSDAEMLSCEFTVTEGPYFKRKIWQYFTLSGGKLDEKGESIGGGISRRALRAILESAHNVHPDDMSPEAMSRRKPKGWGDFNGLVFKAKLGIEKGKDGYQDKNKILAVITPDMAEYSAPAAQAAAAPASTPPWGQTPPPPPAANANPAPSWAR